MTDILIALFIISGLIGMKKPIFGGYAGLIAAPIIHYFFHTFNIIFFIALFPIGFLAGWLFGYLVSWFLSGFRGGKHSTGPSFKALTGRPGGTQRGGIVLTDEERNNVRKNKDPIR